MMIGNMRRGERIKGAEEEEEEEEESRRGKVWSQQLYQERIREAGILPPAVH